MYNSQGTNSNITKKIIVKKIVRIRGNNLKKLGTPNSVSNIISCKGCINKLLSVKKPEANPINMSFVIYPKNIENIAKIIKGKLMNTSLSCILL